MKSRMKDKNGKPCNIEDVYYLEFNLDHGDDGYSGQHLLPVITKGSRDKHGHPVWSWNGDLEKPTLKPSILTKYTRGDNREKQVSHCWLNDGKAQFLNDSTHFNKGKTVDLLELGD